jgi:WD40 repeat protein
MLIDSDIVKDIKTRKKANTREKQIFNLAFSPDDQMIAFSTYDNNLHLWKKGSKTKQVSCINASENDSIYTVSFHPKKNIVAFACNNINSVYIWNINKSSFAQEIQGSKHSNIINAVKFSNNGDILASAGIDGNREHPKFALSRNT